MSYRRSLSFAKHEVDILEFFDANGKSDIAKESMKFYMRYRDKITILPDGFGFIKRQENIKTNDKNKINKMLK